MVYAGHPILAASGVGYLLQYGATLHAGAQSGQTELQNATAWRLFVLHQLLFVSSIEDFMAWAVHIQVSSASRAK